LLDRPDQAEIAFLDEVEHAHPAATVLLGDRDHKAQIRLGERDLGPFARIDRVVPATLESRTLIAKDLVDLIVGWPRIGLTDQILNGGRQQIPFDRSLAERIFELRHRDIKRFADGLGACLIYPAERQNVGEDRLFRRQILFAVRSEEHTSELQSRENLVCRLLLEKKK